MDNNSDNENSESGNMECEPISSASNNYVPIDLNEFDMTLHTITRNMSEVANKPPEKKIDCVENVSLLIKDIPRIDTGESFSDPKTLYGIYFKTILIYGRATPMGIRSKNDTRLYSVDDGTGSVTVHYSHGRKENIEMLSAVNEIERELNMAKKQGLPDSEHLDKKEQKELMKSMGILLKKIKEQTYLPNVFFEHGVKVSVVGIPYKAWGSNEIHVYALEMLEDKAQSRDKEIFFKRDLINRYRTKFFQNSCFCSCEKKSK